MARLSTACLVAVAALTAACAPPRLVLPTGEGLPMIDPASALTEATAVCAAIRTWSAELSVTGRVAGTRVRGRVAAGFGEGGRVRLEGVAPFGAPVFILVVDGTSGTLLLPRSRQIVRSAEPAAILEALVGVGVGSADLAAALTGCVAARRDPVGGRVFGDHWARIDLAGGDAVFLQRDRQRRWRVRAGTIGGVRIEYDGAPLGRQGAVRLWTGDAAGVGSDIRITASDAAINTTLARAVFELALPSDPITISLDELRQAGPLGVRR